MYIQTSLHHASKTTKPESLYKPEVLRVGRKSFLQKYNEKNGWYINWDELLDDNEVYALVVEGSVDIQGLVALHKDDHAKAVYVTWMCSSPENNPKINEVVKYKGVGGHLFAIAANKSFKWGFDGIMYGFAADEALLKHYMEVFGAEFIGIQHPFHFMIDEEKAKKITEVYTYEWTDDKI